MAYGILSDPEKRRVFDAHGEEGVKRSERNGGSGGGGSSSAFDAFFERGRQHQQQQKEARSATLTIPLRVTLRQLCEGASFEIEYTRKVLCPRHHECQTRCPECAAAGVRLQQRQVAPGFVQQVQVADARCVGRGLCFEAARCRAPCPRGLLEPTTARATVDLEPGARDGDRVVVLEEGADEAPGAGRPGDVEVLLRQQQHEFFQREGDDLTMGLRVPLLDALAGFSTVVAHVDGRAVPVARAGVTTCGGTVRVAGEGMPRRRGQGQRGDLIITVTVEFPERVDDAQRELLRQALGPR